MGCLLEAFLAGSQPTIVDQTMKTAELGNISP
jgi:hypothetical protein